MSQYSIVFNKTGDVQVVDIGGAPQTGDAISLADGSIAFVLYRLWNKDGLFCFVVDTEPLPYYVVG